MLGLAPVGTFMRVFDRKSPKALTKQILTWAAAVGCFWEPTVRFCLEHVIYHPHGASGSSTSSEGGERSVSLEGAYFVTTNCWPPPAATLPNIPTLTQLSPVAPRSTLALAPVIPTIHSISTPSHSHSPLLRSTPPRSPHRKHTYTAHSTQHYARQQKPHTARRIQAQQNQSLKEIERRPKSNQEYNKRT